MGSPEVATGGQAPFRSVRLHAGMAVLSGMLAGLEPGLRLGTLVTPVTFRAPGILAKTAWLPETT